MARMIRKKLHTFRELLELAKTGDIEESAVETARRWLQEGQTDHDWYDYTFEMWVSALDSVGFTNAKIQFSGFWRQGDGASFTADVDLPTLIRFLADPPEANKCVEVEYRRWRTDAVVGLVEGLWDTSDRSAAPVLADALEEGGFDDRATLDALRTPAENAGTVADFLADARRADGCALWQPWIVYKADGVVSNLKYAKLLRVIDSIELSVVRGQYGGNYVHESSCRLEGCINDSGDYDSERQRWVSRQPRLRGLWEDFRSAAERLRLDLCRAIYKDLNDEHDYLNADEQLADTSDTNEYHFDEDGDFEPLVPKPKRKRKQ